MSSSVFSPGSSPLAIRALRFDQIAEALRLIRGAVDRGCQSHYGPRQREAVFVSYAATLFVDTHAPLETLVAERDGQLVAVAQLDPADARLRALFVEASLQGHGVGSALLASVEGRARAHGCTVLRGAMALNAVRFYRHAGFRPCAGPERLSGRGIWIPIVRMEKELA